MTDDLSTGDRAFSLLTDRISQEIALKDSLERRGQFLVGTAAAAAGLLATAYGILARAEHPIDELVEALGLASFTVDVLVALFGILAVVPRRMTVLIDRALGGYLTKSRFEDHTTSSEAAANISHEQLAHLHSLTSTNKKRVRWVIAGSIGQGLAVLLLAISAGLAIARY